MKYAIITGGWSPEKEENVTGAKDVYIALSQRHEVEKFIFDNKFSCDQNKSIISELKHFHPDLAFLCTTEELPIQGILDFLGVPYTGPDILPTALSLDKDKCKRLLIQSDIKVSAGIMLTRNSHERGSIGSIALPAVVKPNGCGSSCGISLAQNEEELQESLTKAFAIDSCILVEEFIRGREITVPMLDNVVMRPVEIVKKRKPLYDYESKENYKEFVQQVPANLESSVQVQIEEIMQKVRDIFHLKNIFRADFILTPSNEPVLLEINTLPYLGDSTMGVSAREMGWDYPGLLERIAYSALHDYAR